VLTGLLPVTPIPPSDVTVKYMSHTSKHIYTVSCIAIFWHKKKVPMTYRVTHIKLKYQHHQSVTIHYLQIITHIKKVQNTL